MKWFYGVGAALLIIGLALAGCVRPQCRDAKTGRYVSCTPSEAKRAPQTDFDKVWKPAAIGDINQETGMVFTQDGWQVLWWQEAFEAAKAKGCILHDSCGVFPPYRIDAEYCGDPIEVCPGSSWQAEHDRLKAAK